MTVIINGDTGITSPADSLSGNLTFTGTGNRITGDFSNATQANKVMFQTSTTNANTNVGLLPNGTAVQTVLQLHNNADPTNAGIGQLITNTTDISFRSGITGTGTYLPMTFYTGGSESLRLSKDYKTVILAGGSTSANGTGITFPATQSASTDANTLDDYEEGTFTATPNANLTLGTAVWSYTKVGRVVTVQGLVAVTAVSSTNTVVISGLPFANAGAVSGGTASCISGTMFTGVNSGDAGLTTYLGAGATAFNFYKLYQNGGWLQLSNSDLAVNDEIYCTFSYFTST